MFILKIAWRSILRHKAKSIIIGTILFLGAFIMTLGNATAIGMSRGVEENMVRSFTGHIATLKQKFNDRTVRSFLTSGQGDLNNDRTVRSFD